ncbi:unnamed protein product [Durusdinium trenchii]|uniref:Uncharacterized protein n=1 Tax=Durusdinium trenchii TaxID=1381693 RepID=A0ABP0MZJ2_9DINO
MSQRRLWFTVLLAAASTGVWQQQLQFVSPRPHAQLRRTRGGRAVSGCRCSDGRVSRRCGDSALLLADLGPTPTVVSCAFNAITFLPQYLWLLMVFAPNWSFTRKLVLGRLKKRS